MSIVNCQLLIVNRRNWPACKLLHCLLFTAYCLLFTGCQTATTPFPTPILPAQLPTAFPLTPSPLHPLTPSPSHPPDTGWTLLRPGLERRNITLVDEAGRPNENLYLLRLNPAQFQFGLAYHPGKPQTLADWQQETGALLVVNGGYFTPEFIATGLIVVDGQASGVSYQGFGGMFAVTADGPEIRWLEERPYDPGEPLLVALQSFPMLVQPGGRLGYPEEDGQTARRTVIGQDRNGRILFLLAPWSSFTLHELSTYLVTSDLELDIALNLDGGPSTGLLLADPEEEIPAFIPIPAVITVHLR